MRAAAPCRADAERAAAVLAEAGAGRVVLFGSVARGEAGERSDIDLMAVYDDLDYRKRSEKGCELERLVGFNMTGERGALGGAWLDAAYSSIRQEQSAPRFFPSGTVLVPPNQLRN